MLTTYHEGCLAPPVGPVERTAEAPACDALLFTTTWGIWGTSPYTGSDAL